MRRRLLAVLALVIVLGAVVLLYLKSHALEMIQAVIVDAVIQKAPEGYPESWIRSAFERRLRSCDSDADREAYMSRLKELSQRLEKVQSLDASEVDQILEDVASGEENQRTGVLR